MDELPNYQTSSWSPEDELMLAMPRKAQLRNKKQLIGFAIIVLFLMLTSLGVVTRSSDFERFYVLGIIAIVFVGLSLIAYFSLQKEKRLIEIGIATKGLVTTLIGNSVGEGPVAAMVFFEFEGRPYTLQSPNLPQNCCKKGDIVTLLVNPEKPKSFMVYKASKFRAVA